MYIFLNITQKENVLRKIKELDYDTLLDNTTFNLTKLKEDN